MKFKYLGAWRLSTLNNVIFMFEWEKQHDKQWFLSFFFSPRKGVTRTLFCKFSWVMISDRQSKRPTVPSLPPIWTGRPTGVIKFDEFSQRSGKWPLQHTGAGQCNKGLFKISIYHNLFGNVHNYTCLLKSPINHVMGPVLPLRQTTVNLNCVLYAQLTH